MADYAVFLHAPTGERLRQLPHVELNYSKRANTWGEFRVLLPSERRENYPLDSIIIVERRPPGGGFLPDYAGFVRGWRYQADGRGSTLELRGWDALGHIGGRIVAYFSTSAQARMSAAAGNVIKEIARDNFIDDADYSGAELTPPRDTSPLFSVAANIGDGATIDKSFAWENCLRAMQEVAEASSGAGTDMFFYVGLSLGGVAHVPAFTFRTASGQPGIDRTGATNRLVFSLRNGNLSNISIDYNWMDTASVAYAGGGGTATSRSVSKQYNNGRVIESVWGPREVFAWAANEGTVAARLVDSAYTALNEARPQRVLQAEIIDTAHTAYQLDWRWGDKVLVEHEDETFTAIIREVTITQDQGNQAVIGRLDEGIMLGSPIERAAREIRKARRDIARIMRVELA